MIFLTHRSQIHGLPEAGRCRLARLLWGFHWKVNCFPAGDETEQVPGAPEISRQNHKTTRQLENSGKTQRYCTLWWNASTHVCAVTEVKTNALVACCVKPSTQGCAQHVMRGGKRRCRWFPCVLWCALTISILEHTLFTLVKKLAAASYVSCLRVF